MTDALAFLPRTGEFDRRSFALAAIVTPLAIGLGGIVLIVPAFAALWGLPAYALLGLPLFRLVFQHCPNAVAREAVLPFIAAGFIANLGTYPLYLVAGTLVELRSAEFWAQFCAGFGAAFGPIHGLIFAEIYYLASRHRTKRERGSAACSHRPDGKGDPR